MNDFDLLNHNERMSFILKRMEAAEQRARVKRDWAGFEVYE